MSLAARLRRWRRRRAYNLVAAELLALGPRHCFTVDSSFWSTQTPQGRAIDAASALLLLDAMKRQIRK